jgi:uncharacterized surface protein with fasciclin (FAS1) repeats
MTAAQLLANKPMLESILKFHIVSGIIPSRAATRRGIDLTTLLSGQSLTFAR